MNNAKEKPAGLNTTLVRLSTMMLSATTKHQHLLQHLQLAVSLLYCLNHASSSKHHNS